MPNASHLKNLAAQAKRTDTAIRNLASNLTLGRDDQKVLLSAATVLATSGRKLAVEAKQAKRVEEARRQALDKASAEARLMMADWSAPTTLDKVALCLAMQMEGNLRMDLQSDPKLESSLEYWASQALREMPDHAAYLAIRESKPVVEVMAAMREKYQQICASPGTAEFAQRWQMATDAQAARDLSRFHHSRTRSAFQALQESPN